MDAKPSFDHTTASDSTLQDPSQPSFNGTADPSSSDPQTMDHDLENDVGQPTESPQMTTLYLLHPPQTKRPPQPTQYFLLPSPGYLKRKT
ncbi:hypothetical protein LTR02_000689 [Friedmanniomyces endolithicus]|nr:hypothetical protein LTR75_006729 [Friedmanniomyces endolithicus]KAK0845030.1 hypothetical protein LTR03_007712 [Friedmanniomyces endolithicus]KAK0916557.1 hypothetical protein LTR02_000689 [Friedmanniomyces endolithicus]KAK0921727.1 hypothetical protein LTR57_008525 [Friedmanniomyces endolithicus]KAK0999181.1 hypothetical protein LTS01_005475 [Friedmanniomyces endolithicus]